MSERIQCFMLRKSENVKRSCPELPSLVGDTIWKDDHGNEFVLGSYAVVTEDGRTIPPAPVGAMWDADWYKGLYGKERPDGLHLIVKTPGGDWYIDGPSNNGDGWEREGVPPNITVRPSILTANNRYHGFLTNGQLVEC